jgi:hypothetical protein
MTTAALVISILALVVAVAGAWYARQQARAARASSEIDTARRHDERAPTFSAEVEDADADDATAPERWALCLRLTSQWPVSRLEAEISEGHGVAFTGHGTMVTARDVAHDHRLTWLLNVADDHSDETRLRLTCYQGPSKWIVSTTFSVPFSPRMSVF